MGRGRRSQSLGAWGEGLVAKVFHFKRVAGSGSQWPHKQDLIRYAEGGVREIAQVKATENKKFLFEYLKLRRFCVAESAKPRWFTVVKEGNVAWIFETTLVKPVEIGIGGNE